MPDLLALFREDEFSPGRVADDAAILEATVAALARRGLAVALGSSALLEKTSQARAVLAMCQSAPALLALDRMAATVPVINHPAAIRHCLRSETIRLLAASGVPFPTTRLVATSVRAGEVLDAAPCWVKRGDVHATDASDVTFAGDAETLARALAGLAARGVTRAALQQHVAGTLVKFYGVADGRFFHASSDTKQPPAAIPALWDVAHAGATALGLEVFGGDLIVTSDGTPVLIDVNDWPSFARCREEAAEAIAGYVFDRVTGRARRDPSSANGPGRARGDTPPAWAEPAENPPHCSSPEERAVIGRRVSRLPA